MIYGLIPVGGKATRLDIPYSKEMLPQKNFDYFNPICNHLVEKMELVGASKIYFIHGHEFKKDVKDFFNLPHYIHILQNKIGFANVINDFYNQVSHILQDRDKVIFGLPDSIFNKNPFVEMLNKSGIVCGLFNTNTSSRVDRLDISGTKFHIKVPKTDSNQNRFWGILKFDGFDIKKMIEDGVFDKYSEIGEIINLYKFNCIDGCAYLDLGTWENYNRYLTDNINFSNIEIEKKYLANNIDLDLFIHEMSKYCKRHIKIISTDHYYTINNSNIEFIRYREDNDPNNLAEPDITVKNFNKTQLNRFELSIKIKDTKPHNIMHFLNLVGCKFEFSVTKECDIFYYDDYNVVYYSFDLENNKICIIEIELEKIDFNIIHAFEEQMNKINGFNPNNTINQSKFQLIKNNFKL